jgi:hypothetical protein
MTADEVRPRAADNEPIMFSGVWLLVKPDVCGAPLRGFGLNEQPHPEFGLPSLNAASYLRRNRSASEHRKGRKACDTIPEILGDNDGNQSLGF